MAICLPPETLELRLGPTAEGAGAPPVRALSKFQSPAPQASVTLQILTTRRYIDLTRPISIEQPETGIVREPSVGV